MKIVQVLATGGGDLGGLEKHTLQLCAELAAAGDEVHLFADGSYAAHVPLGVQLHALDFGCSRRNLVLLWKLRRGIERLKPDIVHAQANKAAELVASPPRWLPGVKLATVHGTKKAVSVYRHFAGVIAVSQQLAARLPAQQLRVIYNGVPPQQCSAAEVEQLRAELALPAGKIFLAAGRLVSVKGYDVLLRAFVGVRGTLLIAGDGPEREALGALSARLRLQGRVRWLGMRKDIAALMQLADWVVLSSRREGFPLVLVEALQAGRPLLSTQVSGANELLSPQWLAPVEDIAALQVLLQRAAALAVMPEEFLPLIRRARSDLTAHGMMQRTRRFYQELLQG